MILIDLYYIWAQVCLEFKGLTMYVYVLYYADLITLDCKVTTRAACCDFEEQQFYVISALLK